jgi:hypothetical protein
MKKLMIYQQFDIWSIITIINPINNSIATHILRETFNKEMKNHLKTPLKNEPNQVINNHKSMKNTT